MQINTLSFKSHVESIDLLAFYMKKIYPKKGGGRDNVKPASYLKTFREEMDTIKTSCIEGSYRFAPYKEKLLLKGRNRYPRILSIPIVRDRFVLALLNDYLSAAWNIQRPAPNTYINRIFRFIEKSISENRNIFFFKTDISAFYDNISHSRLVRILAPAIDGAALKLIINAITTPTLAPLEKANTLNERGIPQGLSISSILAAIYMDDFHKDMEQIFSDGLFLRYVDDILVLTNKEHDSRETILNGIDRHSLGVELTDAKTKKGDLSHDNFEYIGYRIDRNRISVKKANLDRFANRIANRCIQASKEYLNPLLRPRYIGSDKEYLEYVESDINMLISGFRVYNHNYGWIAYFQQIDNLTDLYHLDYVVRKHLGKELAGKLKINSIVRTYHDIRRNMGRSILVNFDSVTERGKKIAYLKRFGFIREYETRDISDSEINNRFNIMIQSFVRKSQADLIELS
jgi:prophage PSPPH06, putative reverse transcriptase/maturase